ncbi:hypothetical protein GLOTRDRAFT_132601 [Gloeophyllum trabeum ATCC 11539]|uniref:Uncharacterized protein n=1 Tax=Gloeophyllum trabeum (strain ATCC 11539 / FP-39264 / Madison 617) TaxID=670483 RepID=S7PVX3_GLOTA|nr:uncharacterized protein GLOTRDRAFT_132601 [Gloeophyllum trabeum ATCC 11539]EPQ51786.1 hypothetical protein GLOTRDRAFT_132601 [Gloeophyllum trabeum ATCC 11539]
MQLAPVNILDVPPEVLYDILADPIGEFFHQWFTQTDCTSSWDALSNISRVNCLFSEVASRVLQHALGAIREADGKWNPHPRMVLRDVRRYVELLRLDSHTHPSPLALTIPKTPFLRAYIGTLAFSDILVRIRRLSTKLEVHGLDGACRQLAVIASNCTQAAQEVRPAVLRQRILCAAVANYEQTLMLRLLLDGWQTINSVLLRYDSRCRKATPMSEIELQSFELDLAHALVMLRSHDISFACHYAKMVENTTLRSSSPEEQLHRIAHAQAVAAEAVKMVSNLVRDLRCIWSMSFHVDSAIPDIVESLLWRLDPDHPIHYPHFTTAQALDGWL